MGKKDGYIRGSSQGVPDGKKQSCITAQTGGLYNMYRLKFDTFHYGQLARKVMFLGGTTGQSDVLDLYTGEEFVITATMGVQAKHITQKSALDHYLINEWPRRPDGSLYPPSHEHPYDKYNPAIIKAAVKRAAAKRKEVADFFLEKKGA